MPRDTTIWIKLAQLPLPEESVGACRNVKFCRHRKVLLGNGYCVECWDKGYPHDRKVAVGVHKR